jgi:hypothetical protein
MRRPNEKLQNPTLKPQRTFETQDSKSDAQAKLRIKQRRFVFETI